MIGEGDKADRNHTFVLSAPFCDIQIISLRSSVLGKEFHSKHRVIAWWQRWMSQNGANFTSSCHANYGVHMFVGIDLLMCEAHGQKRTMRTISLSRTFTYIRISNWMNRGQGVSYTHTRCGESLTVLVSTVNWHFPSRKFWKTLMFPILSANKQQSKSSENVEYFCDQFCVLDMNRVWMQSLLPEEWPQRLQFAGATP